MANLHYKFMNDIKEIFKTKGIKAVAKTCRDDLISKGFVYNPIYGWEKPEVLESFGLDPNMKGVPFSYQKSWVQTKNAGKDKFGNRIKADDNGGKWVRSDNKFEWYPTQNWLLYYKSKIEKNKRDIAEKLNTPPLEEF